MPEDASSIESSDTEHFISRYAIGLAWRDARTAAVLASAVVDDDLRLGEADQGVLRVWAVMVGPVPWIAGFARNA
jgi:hypothetical protein